MLLRICSTTGPRAWAAYLRTVGVLQLVIGAMLARVAVDSLGSAFRQGGTFKGVTFPPIDAPRLVEGACCAALALTALVGGSGLLALRPWARRWEAAYAILAAAAFAAIVVEETGEGRDIEHLLPFAAIAILPYLPAVRPGAFRWARGPG